MNEINKFDFLITNFIDYEIKKNIDVNDEIYYYANAIKKVNNKYMIIQKSLNNDAIKIRNLAMSLKIEVVKNSPLSRALYMEAEKEVPEYLIHVVDEIIKN